MAEETVSLHEGSVAVIPQKAEKKSGKRIGFNYIILKSLKESPKNDVVKCIYIKGITNFGFCVIKEGSKGDTKDPNGRDIQDRLKWQRALHERLAGKVRMPKYLGSFEENGNYYLVIEYIKGKSLQSIVRKDRHLRQSLLEGGAQGLQVLGYLEKVVKIIAELHKQNVVHRDVTLNNFMVMPSGKVAVIDMELSYSLSDQFPAPPFALGTHGYMSPEQEAISIPTVKEDIYSLGAIMLAAWSGFSPFKFSKISTENLQRSIDFFVEDEYIASLIGWCMHKDAEQRPETGTILQHLKEYTEGMQHGKKGQTVKRELYTSADISEAIEKGIAGLANPLLCDRERGWFADHLSERPESSSDIRKTWYASFNRGVAGILYFISRAKAVGYDISTVSRPIKQARELINLKYLSIRDNGIKSGFYFGADGIAMSLVETYKNGLLDADEALMSEWGYLLSGNSQVLNLADGFAGQGLAHLSCAPFVDGTRERYFAEEIMNQQLPEGNWLLSEKRRMIFIEYGQAGIIYFLLCHGAINKDSKAVDCAMKGINYLMHNVEKQNGKITWRKKHQSCNNRWCEGNPGMALVFLKAFEITREPVYREWVELTLEGHDESKLWSSLSLCHGISGLGETYLEAAKVLQDEKWFLKTGKCVQILMHMRQQTKRGENYWFMEREKQPVGNLFVGTTGAMHLLTRYLNPGRFDFPGLF